MMLFKGLPVDRDFEHLRRWRGGDRLHPLHVRRFHRDRARLSQRRGKIVLSIPKLCTYLGNSQRRGITFPSKKIKAA